jgi:hypothetical protein
MGPWCFRHNVHQPVGIYILPKYPGIHLLFPPGRFYSAFFRLGQTLETFRGRGIAQPAVDFAIEQLDKGGWVCVTGFRASGLLNGNLGAFVR